MARVKIPRPVPLPSNTLKKAQRRRTALLTARQAKRMMAPLLFYSKSKSPQAKALSNFAACYLSIDHRRFATLEHFYQYSKFSTTPAYAQRFVQEPRAANYVGDNPVDAKRLGGKGACKTNKVRMDASFTAAKSLEIMDKALRIKFQMDTMKDLLLSTGEAELVHFERSKKSFWGRCGLDGKGENQLGKLLMKLRTELRQ